MNLNPHDVDLDTIQSGDIVTFEGTVVERIPAQYNEPPYIQVRLGNSLIGLNMADIITSTRRPPPITIEVDQHWSGARLAGARVPHHETTWCVYNVETIPPDGETIVHLYMTVNPGLVVTTTADNLRADWVLRSHWDETKGGYIIKGRDDT
jgi:hypothetical protein